MWHCLNAQIRQERVGMPGLAGREPTCLPHSPLMLNHNRGIGDFSEPGRTAVPPFLLGSGLSTPPPLLLPPGRPRERWLELAPSPGSPSSSCLL
ncbi:hypothetical protein M513_10206 [Trichuris suis]|uniref:Uncharacterized protein n=1 Tax=Trichuris suis TaxID=68888 RepID=A0A085LV47_9BILA|nr:hypothetical protein M513_10206 [Trichuris suis]